MSERKAVNGALSVCQSCMGSGYCVRVARGSEGPSAASERYLVVENVLCERTRGEIVPLGQVEDLLAAVFNAHDIEENR